MGSDEYANVYDERAQVSIHAPAWGATKNSNRTIIRTKFQSTLPHGERPMMLVQLISGNGFQSTLPHGERQKFKVKPKNVISFNPRSRMGSDGDLSHECWSCQVSIHAPAWGATHELFRAFFLSCVSIHAPAWGATRLQQSSFCVF